jgi:aminodeoxyfutalosine synthase
LAVRFSDVRLEPVWDKIHAGERLSREDGLTLLQSDDLLGIGRMADHVKSRREGDRVYFVINRHITPTNVCVLSCAFCGFARKPGEAGAYEHTIEDMVAMVRDETREVHIVSGYFRPSTPPIPRSRSRRSPRPRSITSGGAGRSSRKTR